MFCIIVEFLISDITGGSRPRTDCIIITGGSRSQTSRAARDSRPRRYRSRRADDAPARNDDAARTQCLASPRQCPASWYRHCPITPTPAAPPAKTPRHTAGGRAGPGLRHPDPRAQSLQRAHPARPAASLPAAGAWRDARRRLPRRRGTRAARRTGIAADFPTEDPAGTKAGRAPKGELGASPPARPGKSRVSRKLFREFSQVVPWGQWV